MTTEKKLFAPAGAPGGTPAATPATASATEQKEARKNIRRSVGVILCRWRPGKKIKEIILVKRLYSISYSEFSRGKYGLGDDARLIELFSGMTVIEKKIILARDFQAIWKHVYGNIPQISGDPRYYITYTRCLKTFSALVGDGGRRLTSLIERSRTMGDTCWGLPKGQVDENETDVDAAFRELREEAGVDYSNVYARTERPSIKRRYDGYRNTEYVREFFVAAACGNISEGVSFLNKSQISEIADVRWFTLEDVKKTNYEYHDLPSIVAEAFKKFDRFPAVPDSLDAKLDAKPDAKSNAQDEKTEAHPP